jgi:putative ABC transport system permease protein
LLSLHRTLSLRYLSRRWFRALLIVASIMLGVATLVATQALSETMSKATLAAGNPMAGSIDLIITNGELPIDRKLADEVLKNPRVKSADPRIFDQAKIVVGDKKFPVMIFGADLTGDKKKADEFEDQFTLTPDITVVKAAYVTAAFANYVPVILGKELDDELEKQPVRKFAGFKIFEIEKNLKKHDMLRVGMIELKKDADRDKFAAFAGHVVILDLDNAAKVAGLPKGTVRRIDIALVPGADPKKVRKEIERIVGGQGEVRTMEEQNQSLQSAMVGMKTGFSMCGVAALIVGMFLVFNALSVSVAERRHEIGILLALGATRDQVWRLFAGEACVLGLVGAALGVPLGWCLAYLGLEPMQDAIADVFATMNLRQVELTWELIGLAFAVGILSAVIASLVPALQAAYDKPAEAVRRIPKEPPVSHLVLHITATLALIIGGMALIVMRDYFPKRWGTYGGLSLVMIGALLAAPLCAQVAAHGLIPISRRFFSIEWRIAADNLVRAPGRTGMVIGALAAGVCLIVETAGIIRSNREAILNWVDSSIASDIVITSGSPVGSGGQNNLMDENLGDELRKVPGVEAVLPNRLCTDVLYRGVRVAISTADASRVYEVEKHRTKKDEEVKLFKKMAQEKYAVIVSGNFSAMHHVHPGDYLTLKSPKGEVKFHIVGNIEDYTWNLGTIVMNRSDYVELWQDKTATLFEVYLRDGEDPSAVKDVISAKLGAQYDLHPLTRGELKTHIEDLIERLYSVAKGQQIVVMIVAALGIVTALLISVLQRRREMGLLRAIGASRAQVVYLVLAEACLMGIFGSLLGFLFALPLQWYALQIVFLEEAGHVFPVHVPWLESVVIMTTALLIAVLAGVGPAIYGVRERIPDAIAYE